MGGTPPSLTKIIVGDDNMKTIVIVSIIILIPLLSCFIRNIYRYKNNLPIENNLMGNLLKIIIKKR